MAASYPDNLFTARTAPAQLGGTPLHSVLHDDGDLEMEAVQAELGTNPRGGDADVVARLDRIDAEIAAMKPATWVPFTPTWTNLTVGNGSQTGDYQILAGGYMCRVAVTLTFGSTTNVTGLFTFTMPGGLSIDYTPSYFAGTAVAVDSSGGGNNASNTGIASSEDGTDEIAFWTNLGNQMGPGEPFSWGTGDGLFVDFIVPTTPL